MKRLLCILGLFGLLSAVLVAAGVSPASAAATVPVTNAGSNALHVVATSPACADVPITVNAGATGNLSLDNNCNYTVVATDAEAPCTVQKSADGGAPWLDSNTQGVDVTLGGLADPPALWFRSSEGQEGESCGGGPIDIIIDKHVSLLHDAAGQLTTFDFEIAPSNEACTEGAAFELTGGAGIPDKSVTTRTVISSYVAANKVKGCSYKISESEPVGWSFIGWSADVGSWSGDPGKPSATVDAYATSASWDETTVTFTNKLDHIPIYVDKDYQGRDYYTTIERGDFHLFTPGLCGAVPFDPFGGLLGSAGLYRTINAVQQTQIVFLLPDSIAAVHTLHGPSPCTYRVQENNAPEGCVAVDPDGTDADGPYWEQTWVPEQTTEFVFHIVNDCAPPPDPTPEPTPTASPTAEPPPHAKKGSAQPSGGASASPKFAG